MTSKDTEVSSAQIVLFCSKVRFDLKIFFKSIFLSDRQEKRTFNGKLFAYLRIHVLHSPCLHKARSWDNKKRQHNALLETGKIF